MKIFYDNVFDSLTTLAGSNYSVVDDNWVVNLIDEQRTKYFGFTPIAASLVDVVWDFQILGGGGYQSKSATAFLAFGHTLKQTDANIKLQADVGGGGSWPTTVNLTWAEDVIAATFNQITNEQFRFAFDAADTDERQIARLFFGPHIDTEKQPDYSGFESSYDSNALLYQTPGGQIYSQARPSPRLFEIEWSGISNTEKNKFKALFQTVGLHKSFFIQVDPSAPAGDELSEFLYVRFRRVPNFEVSGMDNELTWDTEFQLIESL